MFRKRVVQIPDWVAFRITLSLAESVAHELELVLSPIFNAAVLPPYLSHHLEPVQSWT